MQTSQLLVSVCVKWSSLAKGPLSVCSELRNSGHMLTSGQGRYSELHNSCQRSYPYDLRIAYKSLETYLMDSTRCHQYSVCGIGMPNRSRSAQQCHIMLPMLTQRQEITTLARPSLSSEIRERLVKPARASPKQLSEAAPNPSVDIGQYRSQHVTNGSTNGNGAKNVALKRYYSATEDAGDWPPELNDFNTRFANLLNGIKKRHDGVVTTVAQGILEYKRKRQRMQIDHNIQAFLDRFYMSRIGIRMLIGQHIALTDQRTHTDPHYVGIICTKTNLKELAQEAIENARFVCEDHYGLFDAPKVQLVCNPDLNFMYVPGHLSHMLFETLKNSLRAVVETHGQDKSEFPITKVVVAEGKEDITIKISDEGGGIARSAIPLVWTYMYTTVDHTPSLDPDFNKSDFKAPMAGFGYGLPISRLYARYFGGDLKLISMEG